MRASEGHPHPDLDGTRSPAPDLFTALGLVPFAGNASSVPTPAPTATLAEPHPTSPAAAPGGNGAHRGTSGSAGPVQAPATQAPQVGRPGFGGLADLLEPSVDDEALTGPLPRPDELASATSAVDDIEDVLSELDVAVDDEEPAPTSVGQARATPSGRPPAPFASKPGLPDFPAPQSARSGPVPVVDPSAPLSVPEPLDPRASTSTPVAPVPASMPSAATPSVLLDDEEIPARRSVPWLWITLTVMLAAGLGYVLWSQTDLLSGQNPIEARKAEVAADVAEEAAAIEAERARNTKEYGALSISTTPEGARVWLVKDGPEATFENLPVGNEYQVLVAARGHAPRIRVIKGSELGAPVIMDLDPVDDPQAFLPIPEAPAPELDETPEQDTATLTLRSNTEGARLALMVGYTPGAKVLDLDVSQTHRVWVTLAGHELHELELKGRHWEESPDGALMYMESIELTPLPEEILIEDTEGETTGEPEAASAPPPPPKKKKRKKRRRRRRKRK